MLANGSWNGMVGMLVNGETDMVTCGLTQTFQGWGSILHRFWFKKFPLKALCTLKWRYDWTKPTSEKHGNWLHHCPGTWSHYTDITHHAHQNRPGKLKIKHWKIINQILETLIMKLLLTGLGVQRDFPRPGVGSNCHCNADCHSGICHDRKIWSGQKKHPAWELRSHWLHVDTAIVWWCPRQKTIFLQNVALFHLCLVLRLLLLLHCWSDGQGRHSTELEKLVSRSIQGTGWQFNWLKNRLKNRLKNHLRSKFDSMTCLNYPFL